MVELSGEIDVATAPHLSECLATLASHGCADIEVNLADVTFIDSNGLRTLAMLRQRVSDAGGSFVISDPSPMALRTAEITGLSASLFDTLKSSPSEIISVPG